MAREGTLSRVRLMPGGMMQVIPEKVAEVMADVPVEPVNVRLRALIRALGFHSFTAAAARVEAETGVSRTSLGRALSDKPDWDYSDGVLLRILEGLGATEEQFISAGVVPGDKLQPTGARKRARPGKSSSRRQRDRASAPKSK